jgi:hypothetical protein
MLSRETSGGSSPAVLATGALFRESSLFEVIKGGLTNRTFRIASILFLSSSVGLVN